MKFSAQEEYGLRCMIQIAKFGSDGSLTIPEIARVEGLSQTHVAKLLMILRKDGFITSTRGQTGGYALARPAGEINVGEILACLGGKLYDDEFCSKHAGQFSICKHAVDCSVKSLWQVIQGAVDHVLNDLTLADMISKGDAISNVTFMSAPPRDKVGAKS